MNEEQMKALIKLWGDCTVDLMRQMLSGGWRDSQDHDVRLNTAMMNMKVPLQIALNFGMGKFEDTNNALGLEVHNEH